MAPDDASILSTKHLAPLEIEQLADAQDWIERNSRRDDLGPGAKLVIDQA